MCQIRLWLLQFIVLLSASLVVSATGSVEVNFKGSWRQGIGWDLVCSWSFAGRGPGDRLQSTRLYRDGTQFMIYRPDVKGPRYEASISEDMRVVCMEQEKQRGTCVLTVSPTKPPARVVMFTCEVSGERPFPMASQNYELEAFVPAEDARIEAREDAVIISNRLLLNCTATGIPAPSLLWTIDNQIVPADFTGRFWNSTTKTEQAWSFLSVSPMSSTVLAVCTPQQVTYKQTLAIGLPAEYIISSASSIYGKYYTPAFLVIIKLLR